MNLTEPIPPREERQRTDASLQAERVTVDEALTKAMLTTDAVVDGTRADSDALKSLHRIAVDASCVSSDVRLEDEREMSDAALQVERTESDAALARERSLRRTLARVHTYDAQRGATDSCLATERESADFDSRLSTWLLTQERVAHNDTRSALTTRDELLTVIGHDLRSPLSAILAGTSLLIDGGTVGALGSPPRELVKGIRRNVGDMLRLINDLLDAERVAAGTFAVQLRSCELKKLASQAAEAFAPLAAEKRQKLSVELPTDAVVVSCDGVKILQVISNLLANAVKFTPPRGSIVLSLTSGVEWAQISVGDTGPGIPAEDRERIFDRFSQLAKRDRTGLGLGLYIAKSIVNAHGGQFWIASTAGEGSVFSFALPLKPRTEQ